MKIIIAALLITLSTAASAESYEEMNAKQSICRMMGQNSAMLHLMHKRGEQLPAVLTESELGALYQYSNDSALTAPDAKSAHMQTWAKCMDNVRYLYDYYRVNKSYAQTLHY